MGRKDLLGKGATYFQHQSSFSQVKNTIYEETKACFGLDLRSLALFRLLLGLTIIGDLLDRLRDLNAHYVDSGAVSRRVVLTNFYSPYTHHFNPYFLAGTSFGTLVIFLVHMAFSLSLALGYKTFYSTILVWLFTNGLFERNHFINHGGDVLLRVLLFWCLFLPLGKRWSIDSALKRRETSSPKPKPPSSNVMLNVCGFALIIQVSYMYIFAHMSKTGDLWRVHGTATFYALSLTYFQTPIARFLLNFPSLLQLLTFGVLYWQAYGWLLYVVPRYQPYAKYLALLGFFGLHFSFGLSLYLGSFFPACMVSHVPFIPEHFWNQIFFPFMDRHLNHPKKVWYISGCKCCKSFIKILATFFLCNADEVTPCTISSSQYDVDTETPFMEKVSQTLPPTTYGWVVLDHQGNPHYGVPALFVLLSYSPAYLMTKKIWDFFSKYKTSAEKGLDFFLRKCLHDKHSTIDNIPNTVDVCFSKASTSSERSDDRRDIVVGMVEKHSSNNTSTTSRGSIMRLSNAEKKPSTWKKRLRIVKNLVALFFIIFLLKYNYKAHGGTTFTLLMHNSYWLADTFFVGQYWGMFAPNPPTGEWWFTFEITMANGTQVEIFRDGGLYSFKPSPEGLVYDPPTHIHRAVKNHRWMKFFEHALLNGNNNRILLPEFTSYLCREWNRRVGGIREQTSASDIKIWYVTAKKEYPDPHIVASSISKHLLWHVTSIKPFDC